MPWTTWSQSSGPLGAELIPRRRHIEFSALAERLGNDKAGTDLLAQALSHRSWCAEHPGSLSNERLEFLGDSVLGVVVTDHIYRAYPQLPEGELAKLRASVVDADTLAEVALEIDLGPALLLGKGEEASGGRQKPSILADAVEAVIGAVYLHLGPAEAAALVMDLLGARIDEAACGPGEQDSKTRLQELVARWPAGPPRYEVDHAGPDHARWFHARVLVDDRLLGEGEGRTKKRAEQAAARAALHDLSGTPTRGERPLDASVSDGRVVNA